jgi:hypothetical protein
MPVPIDEQPLNGRAPLLEMKQISKAFGAVRPDGKENWLLTEFIELAPMQFIDELVCEMTSLEFGTPGIRPRST